jgi:type I restriction-modification system DNA methylase subunit
VRIFSVPSGALDPHPDAGAGAAVDKRRDVDAAMEAIEQENPSLKRVLPKEYARPGLDRAELGSLIRFVSDIEVGSDAVRSQNALGQVYEYFLPQFASAEGKKGGQFYTPEHVIRLLVEILAPCEGRVYIRCCGSGCMFVQSESLWRRTAATSARSAFTDRSRTTPRDGWQR